MWFHAKMIWNIEFELEISIIGLTFFDLRLMLIVIFLLKIDLIRMSLWRRFRADLPRWPSMCSSMSKAHTEYSATKCRTDRFVDMNTKNSSTTCPKSNNILQMRERDFCSLTRAKNICAESLWVSHLPTELFTTNFVGI